MLHPNADPSDISQLGGGVNGEPAPKKKMGCFKRGVAWVDEHWLKRFLVCKDAEQIRAMDEIDELIERVMEEDPTDLRNARNNNDFMSISPMIRDTLEKRRVEELKQGRFTSMTMLDANNLKQSESDQRYLQLSHRIMAYQN